MKVTKLIHSCLLVEEDNKKFLVDPGSYSWQSGIVKDDHLAGIDVVVVTHAHPDHLNQEFADAIKKSSPDAQWYGPQQVVDQLSGWDIKGKASSDDVDIKFIASKHADLSPWFPEQPEHTSYVLFGELLIGGDCHTLTGANGVKIFGAAVNGGPWGATVGFAKMIEAMKSRPQKVIPLHDWHWHEDARKAIYSQLPEVLAKFDVEFVALENGVTKDI